MNPNTKEKLIEEFAFAFISLKVHFSSNSQYEDFMGELGWTTHTIPPPIGDLLVPLNNLEYSLQPLINNTATSSDYVQVGSDLVIVVSDIYNLENEDFSAYPELGNNFATLFPKRLIDFVVISFLDDNYPVVSALLKILAIIRINYFDGDNKNIPYYHKEIVWNNFSSLLQNPVDFLQSIYRWGDPLFEGDRATPYC